MPVIYLFWIVSAVLLQECESHQRCFLDYIRQMFDPKATDDGPKDLMPPVELEVEMEQDTCIVTNQHPDKHMRRKKPLNQKAEGIPNTRDLEDAIILENAYYMFEVFRSLRFLNFYPLGLTLIFIYVVLSQFYWNKKIQDPMQMGEILRNFTQCLRDIVSAQENSDKELKIKVQQLSSVIMPLPDPFIPLHNKEEIARYLQETVDEIKQDKEVTSDIIQIFTPACLNNLVEHFMTDHALNRNLEMITTENLIRFARGSCNFRAGEQKEAPIVDLDCTIKIKYGDE